MFVSSGYPQNAGVLVVQVAFSFGQLPDLLMFSSRGEAAFLLWLQNVLKCSTFIIAMPFSLYIHIHNILYYIGQRYIKSLLLTCKLCVQPCRLPRKSSYEMPYLYSKCWLTWLTKCFINTGGVTFSSDKAAAWQPFCFDAWCISYNGRSGSLNDKDLFVPYSQYHNCWWSLLCRQ